MCDNRACVICIGIIFFVVGSIIPTVLFLSGTIPVNSKPCPTCQSCESGIRTTFTTATNKPISTSARNHTTKPIITSQITTPKPSTTDKPSSPPPLPSCPPALSAMSQSQFLRLIDGSTPANVYRHYNIEYRTPSTATVAMLKLEFITDAGTWYLDDVSFKEKYDNNNQLLINGNFEIGMLGSSWHYCHVLYPWFSSGHVTNATAHTGTYSFASADFGPGSQDHLAQIINIKGGVEYVLQFYLLYVGEIVSTKISIETR